MSKVSYFRVSCLVRVYILANLLVLPGKGITQNTPGYDVETNTGNGLLVTRFSTPQGIIKTYFTDDLAAGKTISGTLQASPGGKSDEERNQNAAVLNEYVIEMMGQKTNVGANNANQITYNIPGTINTETKTMRLLFHGQIVAVSEVPISPIAPPIPQGFTIPTGGLKGNFLEIKGPGDGVFSADDYVKIGETVLPVIAKSMYKEIVSNTFEKAGLTNISCRENGIETTCSFRNIELDMTASKLDLHRGQTTILHITIRGLEGLEENKELLLLNNTPFVVSLSGGETQQVLIPYEEIPKDGTFTVDRTLTGVTTGSFAVNGNIEWAGVCNSIYALAGLILINPPGLTPIVEQPEILIGECHNRKDADEPGPETVITVNNDSRVIKILAPRNVGTCPIEIFSVDADGQKIPGTSVFLEPGEGIESYIPPVLPVVPKPPIVIPPFPPINPNDKVKYRVSRVVFQCDSRKDGTCKLQIDHWDQNYKIPRGKIKGSCDNNPVPVGPAFFRSLNWIKNTGSCPVELFSAKDGKALDKPTLITPGAVIPMYNPRNDADSVFFKCPPNNDGTCEIELDGSDIHSFPLPEGTAVDVTSIFMVLKGECNGEESTISVTNGKQMTFYGLKNLGTCPLEIYERDELDKKSFGMEMVPDPNGGQQKVPRTTPMTLKPGEEAGTTYLTGGFCNRVVVKCLKKDDGDNCSLQILDRTVEHLIPVNNPPPAPKFKPLRLTIHGECSQESDEKNLISFLGGFDITGIKWITNNGGCPVEIFSTNLSGAVVTSSIFRLEPGQTIESYNPPKKSYAIYFRCVGKAKNDGTVCSLEMEHPLGY